MRIPPRLSGQARHFAALIFSAALAASSGAATSGASYNPFSVAFGTAPKGWGNYNIGDISGDLKFMKGHGVTNIKTYSAGIASLPVNYSDISAYVTNFSKINSAMAANQKATAAAGLKTLNSVYVPGASIAGTKWILPVAAALQMHVYVGANVSGTTIAATPNNDGTPLPTSVTLLTGKGTARTVAIPGAKNYSMAHWDIEFAMMNTANARLSFAQPAAGPKGNYSVMRLPGMNRSYTLGLIVGNEINANGVTPAQISNMIAFAKARRAAYGISPRSLPVTTSANAYGVWTNTQLGYKPVLGLVDGIIFYNQYGFPFDSSGQAQAGPDVTPANGIRQMVQGYKTFAQWLKKNYPEVSPVIGEHGWPRNTLNAANGQYRSFNLPKQRSYFGTQGALQQLAAINAPNFFFEFFSEPWKGAAGSSEANFGVATVTQTADRPNPNNNPSVPPEVRTLQVPLVSGN